MLITIIAFFVGVLAGGAGAFLVARNNQKVVKELHAISLAKIRDGVFGELLNEIEEIQKETKEKIADVHRRLGPW